MISNSFCSFFTQVGKFFVSKIPKSNKKFSDYMCGNFAKSFFFSPCNEKDIYDLISCLKPKKSMGHDGINSLFLKQL